MPVKVKRTLKLDASPVETTPTGGKEKVEILDAFVINKRLSVKAVIGGSKMNFVYPAEYGETRDKLVEHIRQDYEKVVSNLKMHKKEIKKDLIG